MLSALITLDVLCRVDYLDILSVKRECIPVKRRCKNNKPGGPVSLNGVGRKADDKVMNNAGGWVLTGNRALHKSSLYLSMPSIEGRRGKNSKTMHVHWKPFQNPSSLHCCWCNVFLSTNAVKNRLFIQLLRFGAFSVGVTHSSVGSELFWTNIIGCSWIVLVFISSFPPLFTVIRALTL